MLLNKSRVPFKPQGDAERAMSRVSLSDTCERSAERYKCQSRNALLDLRANVIEGLRGGDDRQLPSTESESSELILATQLQCPTGMNTLFYHFGWRSPLK